MSKHEKYFENDPLWYKDAVIYQLHIKSFCDSNGDGIGDLKGLTGKLDYLQNLGITALWLMPFYPSPLKDDGYDISDYFNIHQDYGTLRDFRDFLKEAHKRGIRVITELVLNHTSDQHPWFKRARSSKPDSKHRDFYVWSDTPEKYKDARIIFKDFETSNWAWDTEAKAYYWHRFYFHQPDLNFSNPQVQKEMFRVIDYWMEMGVDGMRLDAVPYIFEEEGTSCENLPETYDFLKKLRKHIEKKFKNRMLLAEANQWPEDAAAYFGKGDICHMAFHFPLMPRMFMSLWMEDRFPIIDILEQTPKTPQSSQWAIFLRNHDELTLEMVTDEERDYMYRMYGSDPNTRINLGIRRRLAPLLGNNRRKIEIFNILLLSFPGSPIIYYGDEIGMGDNFYLGDRNGVRTPMHWSSDRNAGFSQANPQKLFLPVIIDPEYHFESINVENQERNLSSLMWWMRRVISMRKRFKAFSRGSIKFLLPDNPNVLAFIRKYQDEDLLVIVNLSRYSQVAELDLSKYAGYIPQEVFSGNRFPIIKEAPYIFTLGVHSYFWFSLRREEDVERIVKRESIPEISAGSSWENIFSGRTREKLESDVLPNYIEECRWYGGKARRLRKVKIAENIPFKQNGTQARMLILEVQYYDGVSDHYFLPVSFALKETAEILSKDNSHAVIAYIKTASAEGMIYDSIYDEEFRKGLFISLSRKRAFKGNSGYLLCYAGKLFKRQKDFKFDKTQVLKAEQSNSSIVYGSEFILKLYRKLGVGINPELELQRYLTETKSFPNVPSFLGALEYKRQGSEPIVFGMLQSFVQNQGDAWTFSQDSIGRYFERVLSRGPESEKLPLIPMSVLDASEADVPEEITNIIGAVYLEMAKLLGQRTAEMHAALSGASANPDFAPERFSYLHQRALFQSMQGLTKRVFQLLKKNMKKLSKELKSKVNKPTLLEKKIINSFKVLLTKNIYAIKTRIHGDFHLGQVLYTGNDFVIIDFEGEPARAISERRLKSSPVRDVSSMIRSFHYAVYNSLRNQAALTRKEPAYLAGWADLWFKYVSGIFLKSYLATAKEKSIVTGSKTEIAVLLKIFLLEKAVYELGYELNNRPDWVSIPLDAIIQQI